jgi:hypothetical protein
MLHEVTRQELHGARRAGHLDPGWASLRMHCHWLVLWLQTARYITLFSQSHLFCRSILGPDMSSRSLAVNTT